MKKLDIIIDRSREQVGIDKNIQNGEIATAIQHF